MTDAPGPHTGMSRRTGGWLVALFVGVALAALLSLIHLPYAILKPGPVTNTLGNVRANTPLVSVSDARTYPTSGVLDFTTVAVYGGPQHPVNVWDVLSGLVDRSSHVVPEQTMFPKGTTSKQVQEENAAEMADSQQEAIAVALRATGTTVPEAISIAQVPDGSPAKGVLQAGDQVVSVDGVPADSTDAVRAAVQKHTAGEPVAITVRRGGATRALTAHTASADGRTVARRAAAHEVRLPRQGDHRRRGRRGALRGDDVLPGHLRQADAGSADRRRPRSPARAPSPATAPSGRSAASGRSCTARATTARGGSSRRPPTATRWWVTSPTG